ncbi:MAG TPA: pyridoxamine 5'-phosphate oxidase [Polyangiaceae bacterium]|nr:pyridoxamine 5'-phosphate oxidase [Polyangiaceae bacterium]
MTRRTSNPRSVNLDLAAERREYLGQRLLEADAPAEPLPLFTAWLEHALSARLLDATAMVLSTASPGGQPSARVVLLKGHDERGLVFYTRYDSQKCSDLSENPRASALFHWRELDRQIRVDGHVARVSAEESQAYFATRPRSSQLAARASCGLGRVGADELERAYAAATQAWEGREVEMPEEWGGFRIHPVRFEFWQGRPNRLHDRIVYEAAADGAWRRFRLAP